MFMILLIETLFQINNERLALVLKSNHMEWMVLYSGQALSISY